MLGNKALEKSSLDHFKCFGVLSAFFIATNSFSLLMQIIFTVVMSVSSQGSLFAIPPYLWAVVFCGQIPVVVFHELIKVYERRYWIRFQKRCKLEFNTKLGMHSPI